MKPTYAELLGALREMTTLFQMALLCTSPEVAKEGMEFVEKARALVARAEGEAP